MTDHTTQPAASRLATTLRHRPFGLVVAGASVPMFMATLDNLVMTNALPVLHERLGASVEQLQWFVNAYTLAFAGTILIASGLGDRYGRRTVFVLGIAVFGIGSVLAALSSDPTQLIAARAVQGFGAAGVMPLSLALISGGVPAERRPLAIGIWGGISGLGVAVGPLVGGAIMQGWSWQAIFWVNVPVAIVAIPFALYALNNDFGSRARIDVPGALLAGLGVLTLVHGIVRANDDGWTSASVVAELAASAVLLTAFLLWQRRATAPLMPLRLFADRSFSVTNVVGFAFMFGTMGSVFILIQFLQVVRGATPFEAALQTTPWTLMPMIVAPIAGLLAPRVGTRLLMTVGLLLQAVALTWLALGDVDDDHLRPARRAVRDRRHRHGAGVRTLGDRAPGHAGRHRPRQGLGRQLDGPRDRCRARDGGDDGDLHRRRWRAGAQPVHRGRPPGGAHRCGRAACRRHGGDPATGRTERRPAGPARGRRTRWGVCPAARPRRLSARPKGARAYGGAGSATRGPAPAR